MSADPLLAFRTSWEDAESYPLNLIRLGSNIGSLSAHRNLLDANAANLFRSENKVIVLNLVKDGGRQGPESIASNSELNNWLDIESCISTATPDTAPAANPSIDGVSPIQGNTGTSGSGPVTMSSTQNSIRRVSNVRSRFIFFQAKSSEARLNVTREMASRIFTFFQVSPYYLDFISVFTVKFGEQVEAVELRFSGFRARVLLSTPEQALKLPNMALSGRNYQLCYNLKYVARTEDIAGLERDEWQWFPRQGCFHHQFDPTEGTTLWIITSARTQLQKRVEELTGADGSVRDKSFNSPAESFISSLAVHLMLAQWATEDWRGYIRWLEQVLEQKTVESLRSSDYVPSANDISFVQKKEDETNKAIMMLDANADILESLSMFYLKLMTNDDFELKVDLNCKKAVADFAEQLQDYGHDFKMHAARAKTLGKITADRKNLVQQHLQAHTTEQMKILTERAQREAIIMKVIGIVTFLLLPATFVSTFFSTDVVKYQNTIKDGHSGESYSALALQRWFEVTIPLTFATFIFAGCWLYWKILKSCVKWIFGNIILACLSTCVRRGRTRPEDEEEKVA